MEREILVEISKLLEKTGIDNFGPITPASADSGRIFESALVSLKSLNARYDKNDALDQVQWLMNKYNIQIDELIERISARGG